MGLVLAVCLEDGNRGHRGCQRAERELAGRGERSDQERRWAEKQLLKMLWEVQQIAGAHSPLLCHEPLS